MAKKRRSKKENPMQVKTGKVRFSLPSLLRPKKFDEKDSPKYIAVVMVPKSDKETIMKLKKACALAEKEVFPKGRPRGFIYPLQDGKKYATEKELDVAKYKDYVMFKAKSDEQWPPTVVGPNPKERIEDESKIYSGCNGRIVVKASGFDNVSKGVGFYMSLVQILPGGEKLMSTLDPEDVFDQEQDFEDDLDEDFEGEETLDDEDGDDLTF